MANSDPDPPPPPPIWTVTIKNPDGTVHGTATITENGPGVGNPAAIPSMQYTCGFNHTCTAGTQETLTKMKGTGVAPYPDPPGTPPEGDYVTGGTGPSWEATTGGP